MASDCLFCNLARNRIFENKHFYAVFDIHPVSPGHALVIPKKHTVSLFDLDEEQWKYLKPALFETVKIIEKTDFKKLYRKIINEKPSEKSDFFCKKMLAHPGINKKPDGYNIGNNEGEAAGRTIHHLHIQIIPRYTGDVKDHIGGVRTVIPKMGNYKR